MIKDAIAKTIRREDLSQAEAEAAMMDILAVCVHVVPTWVWIFWSSLKRHDSGLLRA